VGRFGVPLTVVRGVVFFACGGNSPRLALFCFSSSFVALWRRAVLRRRGFGTARALRDSLVASLLPPVFHVAPDSLNRVFPLLSSLSFSVDSWLVWSVCGRCWGLGSTCLCSSRIAADSSIWGHILLAPLRPVPPLCCVRCFLGEIGADRLPRPPSPGYASSHVATPLVSASRTTPRRRGRLSSPSYPKSFPLV
jgi:hypothetical protein